MNRAESGGRPRTPRRDESPDVRCARIGAPRRGVITRRWALDAGLSPGAIHRRCTRGEWRVLHPGVYAITSTPASWHQSVFAACCWVGEDAVASHRTAGHLWELPDFGEDAIDVSVARRVNRSGGDVRVHCVESLNPSDVTEREGIPVTTPARTVVDLATTLDPDRLEAALDHVLTHRMASLARIEWLISRGGDRGRKGAPVLRKLLAARRGGAGVPGSPLETKVLQALRRSGLPEPLRQYRLCDAQGLIGRLDFAYPSARIAIEAEGYAYHSDISAWYRDRARINRLQGAGWRVFLLTAVDAHPASPPIVEIRSILRPQLGWGP